MSVNTDITASASSTSVNGLINASASLLAAESFFPFVSMLAPYSSLERPASASVSPPAGTL